MSESKFKKSNYEIITYILQPEKSLKYNPQDIIKRFPLIERYFSNHTRTLTLCNQKNCIYWLEYVFKNKLEGSKAECFILALEIPVDYFRSDVKFGIDKHYVTYLQYHTDWTVEKSDDINTLSFTVDESSRLASLAVNLIESDTLYSQHELKHKARTSIQILI